MIDDGKTSQHCFRIFYGNIPNIFSVFFFFFKWEHSQQFLIPSFSFNPLSGCQVSTALMLQGLADCQGRFINQKLIQLFLSASHFQAVPSFLIYSFFFFFFFYELYLIDFYEIYFIDIFYIIRKPTYPYPLHPCQQMDDDFNKSVGLALPK